MDYMTVLDAHCPEIADSLRDYAHRPVCDYAVDLVDTGPIQTFVRENPARRHFEVTFSRLYAESLGQDTAKVALQEFWRRPALHSGPHLQLYVEEFTFSALLFAYLAARALDLRFMWLLSCSTVKMETRKHHGPGWLVVQSVPLNVFGLARRRLLRSNVCSLRQPLRFQLDPVDNASPSGAKTLRRWAGGDDFDRAVSAFHAGNDRLWSYLAGSRLVKPVLLDDDFLAELVLEHLQDRYGFLSRLVFDPERRKRLHDVIGTLRSELPEATIRYPTDMFWLVRDGRTRRLQLQGDCLVEVGPAADPAIVPIEPEPITRMLRQRTLYPNLFMGYLAAGILTGARLLGGVRQPFYMVGFSQALIATLDGTHDDDAAVRRTLEDPARHGWAMGVVPATECDEQRLIDPCCGTTVMDAAADQIGGQPLCTASHRFKAIRTHAVIGELTGGGSHAGGSVEDRSVLLGAEP